MKRTWYNCTMTQFEAEHFRKYLKENNIKYETSGDGGMVHFEVYATDGEMKKANDFITTMPTDR